jgi:hypothetical protein
LQLKLFVSLKIRQNAGLDPFNFQWDAVEPHPEDKKRGAYERLKLSSLPPSSGKAGRKG